jgi:hypothetical protein
MWQLFQFVVALLAPKKKLKMTLSATPTTAKQGQAISVTVQVT